MGEGGTYTNPVYGRYFADPFLLQWDGMFYAYGTGREINGRVFEVLRSEDLVHWTSLGGAIEPRSGSLYEDWWAPEFAVSHGTFYMYHSAGIGDKQHKLRVAAAEQPWGPFIDLGRILTPDEPFAIDAHPFRDDDGTMYMYYARDFLEGDRVGTALVVDRMTDMLSLEGKPKTVLRAGADWQLFLANRPMYGRVYDWYTLEGPFVVKREDTYYCFYSGGAWQSQNYGVSYAVSDSPLGPFVEEEGEGPKILKSVPGKVAGPGHASIIEGPDGNDYLAYHSWNQPGTARLLCIDRLIWTSDGPRCVGPTFTPQPIPRPFDPAAVRGEFGSSPPPH